MTLIKRPSSAAEQEVVIFNLFYLQTISAGESVLSDFINMENATGFFSLQQVISGSGTIKWTFLLSNDGINFLTPSEASDIATSQSSSSGPNSDGKDIFSFSPLTAKYMQIKATETGGSSSATITGYLAIQ